RGGEHVGGGGSVERLDKDGREAARRRRLGGHVGVEADAAVAHFGEEEDGRLALVDHVEPRVAQRPVRPGQRRQPVRVVEQQLQPHRRVDRPERLADLFQLRQFFIFMTTGGGQGCANVKAGRRRQRHVSLATTPSTTTAQTWVVYSNGSPSKSAR